MDAAGPLFEDAAPGGRLAKGDANVVVAEHGSADGLANGGLGIWRQIGDIDCSWKTFGMIIYKWIVHFYSLFFVLDS